MAHIRVSFSPVVRAPGHGMSEVFFFAYVFFSLFFHFADMPVALCSCPTADPGDRHDVPLLLIAATSSHRITPSSLLDVLVPHLT